MKQEHKLPTARKEWEEVSKISWETGLPVSIPTSPLVPFIISFNAFIDITLTPEEVKLLL